MVRYNAQRKELRAGTMRWDEGARRVRGPAKSGSFGSWRRGRGLSAVPGGYGEPSTWICCIFPWDWLIVVEILCQMPAVGGEFLVNRSGFERPIPPGKPRWLWVAYSPLLPAKPVAKRGCSCL